MYNITTSKVARRELIQQSQKAKAKQNEIMLSTGEMTSINIILKSIHHERTGAKVLMRFDEWKKLGFQVNRNSKSVRIWGKKRRVKENLKDNSSYAFYPMCCLFSESQVRPIDDNAQLDVVIDKYKLEINCEKIH
jgi:hypothetical protein